MENGKEKVTVNTRNLETFLGRSKYSYMMANKKDEVESPGAWRGPR